MATISHLLYRLGFRGAKSKLQAKYPHYEIGRGTYGDLKIRTWQNSSGFSIGAYCSIAQDVQVFLGGEHRIDWITTFPFSTFSGQADQYPELPFSKGDVSIGNDVWIGTEAMILSGVTIGDGAVIGARAVVSRDVPPYAVVTGNPAKIVKYRFDETTIEQLLKLQWWNWSKEKIDRFMPLLLDNDIEAFLAKTGDSQN
jgi:acetyltransferase-like isoleucine patch superfamily enzyme